MTKRDLAVSLLTTALVLGATYYAGPLGGRATKAVVVPRVERALREAPQPAPAPVPNRLPPVAGLPVTLSRAACEDWRAPAEVEAYYRALLREGVFPVTTHEARP